jgi:hypothetical protein
MEKETKVMAQEKATIKNTNRGTQIAYIPGHALGKISHQDVQFGFVTSKTQNGAFCRYFQKKPHHNVLRTTANSELTPWGYLVLSNHHTEGEIERILEGIDKELERPRRY